MNTLSSLASANFLPLRGEKFSVPLSRCRAVLVHLRLILRGLSLAFIGISLILTATLAQVGVHKLLEKNPPPTHQAQVRSR